MSFLAVQEVLIAEFKLLAQCDGIKEQFDKLIEDTGVKVPGMFLQCSINLRTEINFSQHFTSILKIHSMEKLSRSQPQAAAPCLILDSSRLRCSLVGVMMTQFVSSRGMTALALQTTA